MTFNILRVKTRHARRQILRYLEKNDCSVMVPAAESGAWRSAMLSYEPLRPVWKPFKGSRYAATVFTSRRERDYLYIRLTSVYQNSAVNGLTAERLSAGV
jgi:hypothetical protein